jgi:hypothetical protein
MSESITSALASIGNSSATKGAMDIAQLGSTGYNLYNNYQNQQYQNNLRSYAQDPTKMNEYASKFTKPLDAGLQTSVANNTQAYLAQRGLSESPQISQQVQAQAIAPYVQENQKTGYSDALQALGLGGGANTGGQTATAAVSGLAKTLSSLGGLGKLNQLSPAQLNQFIQGGATQPATLDSTVSTPDYSAGGTLPATDLSSLYSGNEGLNSAVYTPDYAASLGSEG